MSRRPVVAILTALILTILVWPLKAQQKPFTHDQITKMVQAGLGDETGAKAIEERGIDFAPSEDFIETLKTAGASEAFLNALRAAKPPEPASTKKPINQVQVFALLVGQVPSHRVSILIQERGIDFELTDEYLQEVRLAGGEDELVSALKAATVAKPEHVNPAVQARQTEIIHHVARGAQFLQSKRYTDAETEYRAAVRLDPGNANLHTALAAAINVDGNPDGAIVEDREALRLDPTNENAHVGIGNALADKGDWDGAASEFRETVRREPDNEYWHCNLGAALGQTGDLNGAIEEYHAALRLNPSICIAHTGLGIAFEQKGDLQGALREYRTAYMLDPRNVLCKQNYERLVKMSHR